MTSQFLPGAGQQPASFVLGMAEVPQEFTDDDVAHWCAKGGGAGGILKSVAIGAALGALTGGIGFAVFEMGATFSSAALGIAAGTWQSAVVGGAIMGTIGGGLVGAGCMMEARA